MCRNHSSDSFFSFFIIFPRFTAIFAQFGSSRIKKKNPIPPMTGGKRVDWVSAFKNSCLPHFRRHFRTHFTYMYEDKKYRPKTEKWTGIRTDALCRILREYGDGYSKRWCSRRVLCKVWQCVEYLKYADIGIKYQDPDRWSTDIVNKVPFFLLPCRATDCTYSILYVLYALIAEAL